MMPDECLLTEMLTYCKAREPFSSTLVPLGMLAFLHYFLIAIIAYILFMSNELCTWCLFETNVMEMHVRPTHFQPVIH